MICDKKEVYFFQNHFVHKNISNRMLAVLLEANASFHERIPKKLFSLNVPNKLSFLKKIYPSKRTGKSKRKSIYESKKLQHLRFRLWLLSGKKQPRNKILSRQDLIWVMVFRKIKSLCFLVFFEKHGCVSKKITIPCPCKKGYMKKNEGKFLDAESLAVLTQKSVSLKKKL